LLREEEVFELFPDYIISSIILIGQGFGEYSLIKNLRRNDTVIAREDIYLLSISKEFYLKFLGTIQDIEH